MMRSLFSGVSGLKNHQTAMDVIGNNVANVNTTAYKANRVIFSDIVNQTIADATAPTDTSGGQNSKQIGLGVQISAIAKDMTEGSAQNTDCPLDFTIQGEGYFAVLSFDGT
ncbi:MAG: flagellar hook-basal body complex protein, partial [Oscillospiraceae bacterium]|nr:flagellar hook-basal body complex protein [Oscillospiraceae bacterium]